MFSPLLKTFINETIKASLVFCRTRTTTDKQLKINEVSLFVLVFRSGVNMSAAGNAVTPYLALKANTLKEERSWMKEGDRRVEGRAGRKEENAVNRSLGW